MSKTLLVDIGNTHLHWAFSGPDGLTGTGRCIHTGVDWEETLDDVWGAWPAPSGTWVSNVAGSEALEALREWMWGSWGLEPRLLIVQAQAHGVRNAYRIPDNLGSDRWAALIAAHHDQAGASLIVDCGTATTLDLLDDDGAHLGGLIVPGLGMMRRSLLGADGVANAQAVEGAAPGGLLAGDTAEGVQAGTLYAAVATIDRVVADVTAELGQQPRLLMTGGDASAILGLTADAFLHRPWLVLEGLASIAGAA